jgi:SAM-dependent methyltransferase
LLKISLTKGMLELPFSKNWRIEKMSEVFNEIYKKNKWGSGSGAGSLPKHTKGYVNFLQNFLKDKQINSVVDMGCGDWQFSNTINWTGVDYLGFDVVKSVIERNVNKYSDTNIQFELYSGNPEDLPYADLLIVKDVLQHLSKNSIDNFLKNIDRYKFCLITNCVNPFGETVNAEIQDGGFSHLDVQLPPFNIQATEVFSFTDYNKFRFLSLLSKRFKVQWLKKVLLIEH